MLSLFRRLRANGVLGMNARNVGGVLGHNPRVLFPTVDDKLRLIEVCKRVGVPTPAVYAVVSRHGDLRHLGDVLRAHPDCVLKPARGSGGRGILLLTGVMENGYRRHNGDRMAFADVRRRVSDILSGLHSLGGRPDRAMFQRRLTTHPDLERLSYRGAPDIRVLVYRGEPAMAMLRLPTLESAGRANLHQGGVGVGVEVETGITTRAIWHGRVVERHPDTGEPLAGRAVPDWPEVLRAAKTVARATGLGYVGIDVVPDTSGPMVLEANARPGLAIQTANGRGLLTELRAIDRRLAATR